MSTPLAIAPAGKSRLGRSVLAVVAAIVANVVLSVGVDQVLHVLGVYPPWGQPMNEPELNALALSYRLVFAVAAGYIVARLAPSNPAKHAVVLGVISVVLSTIGVVAAFTQDLGPAWYPIALAVIAYPSVRFGALLHERLSD
jgi:hypothetical protein